MPEIPFYQVVPLLSAGLMLGEDAATDKESFFKQGAFTDEVVWRSQLDVGFPATIDSLSFQGNFKASVVEAGTANEASSFAQSVSEDTVFGAVAWTGLEGITNGDSPPNTPAQSAALGASVTTYYVKATNFGFNIPADATILGIKVFAGVGSNSTTKVLDSSIAMYKNNVIVPTSENFDTDPWWNRSWSVGAKSWGGATHMWGTTWTPAEINAAGFGAAISAKNIDTTGGKTAQIESIKISVYYTLDPPDLLNNLYCGTCVEDTSFGTKSWIGLMSNVQDDSPTTQIDSNLAVGEDSYYAKCTNFGFNLPSSATIVGIQVEAETHSSDVYIIDGSVKIVKGGTISGTDKADSVIWQSHYREHPSGRKIWGGATDLWGLSWISSDINASGFGVAISCNRPGGASSGILKTVRIRIYYTQTFSTKWQIKPDGSAWEDIPGTEQTVGLDEVLREFPIKALVNGDTGLANNDLPADVQLLFTGTGSFNIELQTLHNSAGIVGKSKAGSATNYPFDWAQWILSSVLVLGNEIDIYSLQVDNPSSEVAFVGYVDAGVVASIANLEANANVAAKVDSGSQSTDFAWQIRPVNETVWKDVITSSVTLTSTLSELGPLRADKVSGDFTGWSSGLKAPFEYRLVFSATGSGKTFTFVTTATDNYCRINGAVD